MSSFFWSRSDAKSQMFYMWENGGHEIGGRYKWEIFLSLMPTLQPGRSRGRSLMELYSCSNCQRLENNDHGAWLDEKFYCMTCITALFVSEDDEDES